MTEKKLHRGGLLIELVLAMGLAAIILPALLTGFVASREGKAQQIQRMDAIGLLKETEQAVKSVRESDWANVATNGTYHPLITNNQWELASGVETVQTFYTREIVIGDVYRDSNGAIVASGGSVDPSTKEVVITISWTQPYASSLSSTMYLTRTADVTYTQTTEDDFETGTRTSTSLTSTSGGEVVLGAGQANWCSPEEGIVSTLTLPKQGRVISAKQGEAFVGTGDGTSGEIFVDLAINTPLPPATPSASIISTFSGTSQTNAIYSDGTYAYLAINGSTNQVLILNIASQPFTQVGTISVPSGTNANGVYVANDIAYVTSSNMLYTYNVTTKTGTHSTPLASKRMWIGLGNSPLAKDVVVVGDKAYVGTANTLFGLQVFKVSSGGSTLKLVGVSNWTIFQSAQGVTVNSAGTRAYTAFDDGVGSWDSGFYIVNTSASDPPAWWPLPNFYDVEGSYDSGSTNATGMTLAPGSSDKALLVGDGGTYQYQVIDISNESNPTLCGGLAIGDGIEDVAGVEDQYNNVYSYIITSEAADQFKIIQGGEGGGNYTTSGTFESSSFDAGYSSAFNRFTATVTEPTQTDLQVQLAVAPAVGGSCDAATYTYVGPDGTSSSYFTPNGNTITAQFPVGSYGATYENPERCFRYKAWFTTSNTNATPTFYDITINYSQ